MVCAAGLVSAHRQPVEQRSAFRFYGFLALSALSIVALIETLFGRIELRDDDIRVVGALGSKRYPRSAIESASWEKGCPVSLKMATGGWVNLPDTGHANTKVAGAVRAWLNESGGEAVG